MIEKYRGESAYLTFTNKNSAGVLTDADTYTIEVVDSVNAVVVADAALTPSAADGTYTYSYDIGDTAVKGTYIAQATLTTGSSINKQGIVRFKVVDDISE